MFIEKRSKTLQVSHFSNLFYIFFFSFFYVSIFHRPCMFVYVFYTNTKCFSCTQNNPHYTCMTLRTTCIIKKKLEKQPRNPIALGFYTNTLSLKNTFFVATLALGLRPKQRFARAQAKRNVKECENEDTLPSELPFWELESRWTPKLLESDCKGQNTSH